MTYKSKIKITMELRPALDGYYGIPHETRLLFSALAKLPQIELSGLLQMSRRMTRGGIDEGKIHAQAEKVHRYSRTVVSLKGSSAAGWKQGIGEFFEEQIERWFLRISAWFGLHKIKLRKFETIYFEDFIWQAIFARSLPSDQRSIVLKCNHFVCATPWRWMHVVGLDGRLLFRRAAYPCLNFFDQDIFITQTPYPGRLSKGTTLVVHYHDAIPILMPHTISDRAFHQASHFHALESNVRDNAWFVCVSEATRQDLIGLFPEVEKRSVTIHNMLSNHYYLSEPEPERVAGLVRRHIHGKFRPAGEKSTDRTFDLSRNFISEDDKTKFYQDIFGKSCKFILMVSTLEPRKNHSRLLEAWERVKDRLDPDLKLVFVGHIGWDYNTILDSCIPAIEQGGLFLLHSVPSDGLRVLYQNAIVTVCPSLGEGFDFSGVEAMRCGGVVAASDIPVHREIYGEAAEYFDPYDTSSLVDCLESLIFEVDSNSRREKLRAIGIEKSDLYLPEKIVPQWENFLNMIH